MHSFRFILPTPHRLARHQSLHDLTSAKAGIDPASRLIVTANKIGLSISFPLALVEPLATRSNSTYVFERLWQCCCHIVAPDVIHPQPPHSRWPSEIGAQNALQTDLETRLSKFAESWSGRRESNPRMQLGKLPFYH